MVNKKIIFQKQERLVLMVCFRDWRC